MIRKDKHPIASLLFGAACIQFFTELFVWMIHGPEYQWTDWAMSCSFLLFAALGIWARWMPMPAATVGVLLYAAYLSVQAVNSLELLCRGWIFKLPIAALLTIAFVWSLVLWHSAPPEDADIDKQP
jgi:hypothetical protein